jgi:hypothetical protein
MQLQQGDPIEERYKEYTERGAIIEQFNYCIASYREAAMSADPKFDHIDINEKQKVIVRQFFSLFHRMLQFILKLCVFILTCL